MNESDLNLGLPEPTLENLRQAVAAENSELIRAWADGQPVDLAETLADLDEHETVLVASLLGDARMADVVAELYAVDAADVLERLAPADAADVLEEMSPDDAADVVEELDDREAETVLSEMLPSEASELRELMAYPPDSAGGIMTTQFATVQADMTVAEAIAAIRRVADEAETLYYVYLVDGEERLRGVLSLRDLLLARSSQPVTSVITPAVVSVLASADQSDVAHLFREHRFTALPVVDDDRRLLGIITADDVQEVIEEETTEDIERLGGSQPLDEPYLHASVLSIFRKRVVWLLLLLLGQAYTASVITHFDDELTRVIILAAFIPMLIGTGGNVGSQTVTMIIRAMGLDDVRWPDLGRVIWKELRVALLIGVVMGSATFIRAGMMGTAVDVGTVVGLSAAFIVVWSGLVSAALPLILRRAGVDPAVVSAPMITTIVDGTGLFIYFEVARYVLHP